MFSIFLLPKQDSSIYPPIISPLFLKRAPRQNFLLTRTKSVRRGVYPFHPFLHFRGLQPILSLSLSYPFECLITPPPPKLLLSRPRSTAAAAFAVRARYIFLGRTKGWLCTTLFMAFPRTCAKKVTRSTQKGRRLISRANIAEGP